MSSLHKSALCALIAIAAAAPFAGATTLGFGAGPASRIVVDSTSAEIPAGSLVWAGAFNNESFSLNTGVDLATNVANIEAAGGWKQFGLNPSTGVPESTTNTLTISSANSHVRVGGQVTDNITGSPTASADYFNGKQVYLWVFNASTVGAATEMGIYKATTASPPWVFPTNGGGTGDGVSLATTSAGATITSVNSIGSADSNNLHLVPASPVPESSSFVLIASGMLGLLGYRRLRRLG